MSGLPAEDLHDSVALFASETEREQAMIAFVRVKRMRS